MTTKKHLESKVVLLTSDTPVVAVLSEKVEKALSSSGLLSKGTLTQSPYGILNNLCQKLHAEITVKDVGIDADGMNFVIVYIDFHAARYFSSHYIGPFSEKVLCGYAAAELLENHGREFFQGLKQKRKQERAEISVFAATYSKYINDWRELWPDIFSRDHPKPLAAGVKKEIGASLDISKQHLNFIFAKWVGRREYSKSIVENTHRFNLDGTKGAVIDDDTKENSKNRLGL